MKKFLSVFGVLLCVIVCAFSLIACSTGDRETPAETHTSHNWSSSYIGDGDRHYQTCDGCSEKKYSDHDYGTSGVCVCGKVKPADTQTQYNVIFNANGGKIDGDDTKTILVNINQTITRPNDPERTDYKFTGWYKDSTTTELWNFDTDTVKKATTLYAGWEMNLTEYDVTFELNYPESFNVVKSTENGFITYVPVREGFIFNGWWYSDGQTADGSYILSEKFDTSKRITSSGITLYAEWVQERTEDAQLYSPSVSIADGVFSWNAVDNAQSYRVEMYSGSTMKSAETLTETNWMFPDSMASGYYTVKIRANGDGIHTVNSAYTQKYYAHRILSSASGIEFNISTSVLSWSAVKGATEYEIRVNNTLKQTISETLCDLSDLDAGDYTVSVTAKRLGYSSSTATKAISKKRLSTPNVTVTENLSACTYTISWTAVAHANSYRIKHHDTYITITKTSYTISNDSPIYDENGTGEFSVCAYDNNADYFISNDSESITVKKIYTLTLNRSNTAAGSTYSAKVSYKVGDSVTISAYTNTGYTFIGWYDNERKLADELNYTFIMPSENKILTAKWCKVTIESNNASAGSVSGLNKAYKVGENATITASAPGLGCVWLGWYDGEYKLTEQLSYTFIMPSENKTYTAKWEVDEQLKRFVFVSTEDTVTITGVVNKSATSIVIPDYVTGISSSAFQNCSKLTSIEIPKNVTNIEDNAFSGCTGLTNITVNAGNSAYSSQDGILYNKAKTEIKFVPKAISGGVTIPGSVTNIKDNAFSNCSELASITVNGSNTVYSSQDGILYNKAKTEIKFVPEAISGEVTIPGSVTSIGSSAFRGRTGLTKVVISDGVTSIGSYAFYDCSEIASISIPDSIMNIGASAFYNCSKIIRNDGSLRHVGRWIIGRDSLADITGLNLRSYCGIADGVFKNCSSLKTVTLGSSIKSIGNEAFYGCYNLKSITFEGSVETWNTVFKGTEWNKNTQAYTVKFDG